ncbi:winged helix-turn-helix domain-containing protein [Micromonospora sp. NPDC049175]|uniref:winged helix-turn-helix domain-containing protein n=1 Tax=Micromonospora sp. NPDC049175 TaxID=3364266 RepID=UPI00371233F3
MQIRLAPQPVWEVLTSAQLLAHHGLAAPFPYQSWARSALSAIGNGPARALLRWVASWPPGIIPQFLISDPRPDDLDLTDACRRIESWEPTGVRDRLHRQFPRGVPPAFGPFAADPARALQTFRRTLEDYCDVAIRPHWGTISETLVDELAHRSGTLATGGVDALLGSLHQRVGWNSPTLTLTAPGVAEGTRDPQRLLLVPLVFARDEPALLDPNTDTTVLGYPARGVANLAGGVNPSPRPGPDHVVQLLGRTRATLMRALSMPRTTTALATELRLAPSTISEHLSVLVSCRIAIRTRRANRVYYGLTDIGSTLLDMLMAG